MLMYNLIEHSDSYSKIFGSLYQFFKDEPLAIISESKSKFLNNANNAGIINEEIVVLSKYFNSWRTFEMAFINREINLILTL